MPQLARLATDPPTYQRKPHRISITVSWGLYKKLQTQCDAEGRSLSNLAAHILEAGVA